MSRWMWSIWVLRAIWATHRYQHRLGRPHVACAGGRSETGAAKLGDAITYRSYRGAARVAALLLACSMLQAAPAAAQAQTTAAATPGAKLGAWGVDLAGARPVREARRRLRTLRIGYVAGEDRDPGRQARGQLLLRPIRPQPGPAEGAGHQRPRREQIRRDVPEHDGRGAGRELGHRAAEGRPREGRGNQEQGRVRALHGRDEGHLRKALFVYDLEPDTARRHDERALPVPVRSRHAEPRLLPEARVQDAARCLSRLHRADVQGDRQAEPGRGRRSRPRRSKPRSPRSAGRVPTGATSTRPTIR